MSGCINLPAAHFRVVNYCGIIAVVPPPHALSYNTIILSENTINSFHSQLSGKLKSRQRLGGGSACL